MHTVPYSAFIWQNKTYFEIKSSSYELAFLGEFLRDDIHNVAGWIEWTASSADLATDINAAWLQKINDDVLIGDITDVILERPKEKCLTIRMSQKNMIDILRKWDRVLKEKPSEFWLTEKDGVYDLHFEKPEWVDEIE